MARRLLICFALCLILQQAATQNRQSPQTPLPEPEVFFSRRQAENLPPKREFRGAWLHTVAQTKYAAMSERGMKQYFSRLLDLLHEAGINTVIFQIRPQADAWYNSSLEPWSEFITGRVGRNPGWDPLAYMVDECHRRNMDIHAWINPYRVKLTARESAFRETFIRKNRNWIVRYGSSLWFDPGIPDCREHIVKVVSEIVKNYDIDGIHMDDYFYPYPIAGLNFPDDASFRNYGKSQGYNSSQKDDWRRNNVNTLVRELHETIRNTKPWVRFGISPFGIYRNIKQDPQGSETDGLSNYDDLYADALLWMKEGWIDYCVPQLYWEIGHSRADYQTLAEWWGKLNFASSIYVGQDIVRTMNPGQLQEKMTLVRNNDGLKGNCFWPAYELENNTGYIVDSLVMNYHYYPSLPPVDLLAEHRAPEPVYELDLRDDYKIGKHLSWKTIRPRSEIERPAYFVIYRFLKGYEPENIEDPRNIIGITQNHHFVLPSHPYSGDWLYVVTALSRVHSESAPEGIVLRVY